LIDQIRQTSKHECERLGSCVSQFIVYFRLCIDHTIDRVSYSTDIRERILLLEQSKSLVETSLQLLLSCKESAGNVKNLQWHRVVDNNCDLVMSNMQALLQTCKQVTSTDGHGRVCHRATSTVSDIIADLVSRNLF
jgi:talin